MPPFCCLVTDRGADSCTDRATDICTDRGTDSHKDRATDTHAGTKACTNIDIAQYASSQQASLLFAL